MSAPFVLAASSGGSGGFGEEPEPVPADPPEWTAPEPDEALSHDEGHAPSPTNGDGEWVAPGDTAEWAPEWDPEPEPVGVHSDTGSCAPVAPPRRAGLFVDF